MARRWLARLSFSFFILAAVLLWEVYNIRLGRRGPVPQWRVVLYLLAAVLGVVLGAVGVRERHRAQESGEPGRLEDRTRENSDDGDDDDDAFEP